MARRPTLAPRPLSRRRFLPALAAFAAGPPLAQSAPAGPVHICVGAPPGGSQLLPGLTCRTIDATLYPRLPCDPVADFTPPTMGATSPGVLVTHPGLPVEDVRELIAGAEARPGQLGFAVGGIGSALHLAGEAPKLRAGLYIAEIPCRGPAPALADVVAGNVPLMFAAVRNASEEFAAIVRADGPRRARLVRHAGARPEGRDGPRLPLPASRFACLPSR